MTPRKTHRKMNVYRNLHHFLSNCMLHNRSQKLLPKHARSRGIFTTLCCNYSSRMDRTGRNIDPSTDTLRGAKVVERQSITSSTTITNGEKRSQNCNDAAPSSRHLKQNDGRNSTTGMILRVLTNSGTIVVVGYMRDEDKKGSDR